MPTFYSDLQTTVNGPAFGQPLATRAKANRNGGRLRFQEFAFVVPAATLAIADKIVWGKLPLRARLVGHLSRLNFTTGTAASTVNLGDNVLPARYMAATAVTTAGSAVPTAAEQSLSATLNITSGSTQATIASSVGAFAVGALITGTGIPANTTIVGVQPGGVGATVTLSSAATATTAALAVTVIGASYEATDDSNNVANGFASTVDDCTLTSVVAGAVLAAGQVLTLKVAYVQD